MKNVKTTPPELFMVSMKFIPMDYSKRKGLLADFAICRSSSIGYCRANCSANELNVFSLTRELEQAHSALAHGKYGERLVNYSVFPNPPEETKIHMEMI